MSGHPAERVLVVCPLTFEASAARSALRRAGLANCALVVVSGPGAGAAREAVRAGLAALGGRHGVGGHRGIAAVLFGTCGSLHPGAYRFGAAGVVDVVVNEAGQRWRASLGRDAEAASASGCVLVGVDSPLWTADEKRACHERTGADVADCESAGFASACEEAGVVWGVVRGVSDGWHESLPLEAAHWVTATGRTRVLRVVWDCVRSPSLVPRVIELGRKSSAALRAAGERLVQVVREVGACVDAPGREE